MKFGHVFKETLKSEGFPPDWVDSAISYSQLKKCINALTNELAQVGLDRQTLGKLLRQVEEQNAAADELDERPLEYLLSGENGEEIDGLAGNGEGKRKPFHPKLLFYVHEETGELDSAALDECTRKKLQTLAVESGMTDLRVFEEKPTTPVGNEGVELPNSPMSATTAGSRRRPGYRTVEIPLTSDSEFFEKLVNELSGLEALQEREEKRMHTEIEKLGNQVARLTNPDRRANRKLITVWRQIFQVYLESDIFFGTTESDHTGHNAVIAGERFQQFSNDIARHGLVEKFKKAENLKALNTFMHINQEILQGLRFGEINRTAMVKILKKFDKQTALGVKSTFPRQITYPEFSEHLAKAVCAQVNTQILTTIPQIDDYSCPMCMELKWRPVRLRCSHVFCIRCLIVMQTNKQHCCPLCREKTVIDACSDNLDLELTAFLKKWFPDEVKAKQKYNELMAGVDQYGEVYKEKCVMM
ncbi:RING-14 protein-like protein [Dendryphion nanum]|uniref:RING-14 protein-like protein n=1 Tax=Dendryphion nanum TaxID=256645 RepID=A0A9P9EHW9_9PLEO|nr:RING-14 protein-like protein [Dendryphion nanum]